MAHSSQASQDHCPHLHAARACTLYVATLNSYSRLVHTPALSCTHHLSHIALFMLTVTVPYPFAPSTVLCPLSLWSCSLVLVFAPAVHALSPALSFSLVFLPFHPLYSHDHSFSRAPMPNPPATF
ncbi:hypothetical protein BKA62DRAFT_719302 [Auriculariales sp. MPI-PUGE-AT-0066]|nr:hypothetical protein BKA62DRAFT_719302 [Auriculariales sp. MPI-PUGE-AT-0066]